MAQASGHRPIPESYLDELCSRADIEAVIGARVPLKKAGNNLIACCPFHKEKSPSFSVSPSKGFYHCFGCGASGSALTFLIEHDGTPFREAVTELAHACGMALPVELMPIQHAGGAASVQTADYAPLYEANTTAYRWFRQHLRNSEAAKSYLKGRGMTGDSLKRFLIGAVPDEWQGLAEAFPDYEKNQMLVDVGLVRVQEESGRRYDVFRNRAIFGIRDTRGRIVGFGGRAMGDSKPKYLNTQETPIFDKGALLFGLYEARDEIRRQKHAFACEGYMDVVMLAQHGILNAVASLGTAFTRAHAERLLTQTKAITFSFDGDAAGRKAAYKACLAMLPLISEDHDIRVLVIPDDQDPDEFVRSKGPAEFLALQTSTLLGFLLAHLANDHNIASPEGKARAMRDGEEILSQLQNQRLRKIYLQTLQEFWGVASARGTAGAPQRVTARTPSKSTGIWARLTLAARQAPATAIAMRDHIVECLDLQVLEESVLARALQAACVDTQPEGDTQEQLLAHDLLANALSLIVDIREKQCKQELRRQFEAEEIDLPTYLRQSTSM